MGIVHKHKHKHKHTLGSFICHNSNNYLIGSVTTGIANILIHGHFDFFFFLQYIFYLLCLNLLQYVFNYNPEKDIFACVADIGWITGHSYVVYGPLCNGGTTVLCEFHRTHPDAGKWKH